MKRCLSGATAACRLISAITIAPRQHRRGAFTFSNQFAILELSQDLSQKRFVIKGYFLLQGVSSARASSLFMREIPLTNSTLVALIDDDIYDFIAQFKWRLMKDRWNTYAWR